jgi:hypothetical protein
MNDKELRSFFLEHGIVNIHCAEESECDPIEALGEFLRSHTQQIALEAKREVVGWLEADLKRLDSRNWSMETMVLDHLVAADKADEYQKDKRQQIVEDRRAAHALYAILNNYKATLKSQQPQEKGQE